MKTLLDNTNNMTNNLANILKGIILSIIITLILLFIYSICLTYTNIGENTIAPVIIVITSLSILIGSSISTIKIKKNGLLNGGIIGGVYILFLYIISSIVETGFSLTLTSAVMLIFAILAGMAGGIVGVNIKK